MAVTQHDGAAASTRPAASLRALELSDEFVKLLGVEREAAESLHIVFAARCRQLLPVRGGTHDDRSRGANANLSTRVASRVVLLTGSGTLFVLKNRLANGCRMMERLEFGAHLHPHDRQTRNREQMTRRQRKAHSDEEEEDDEAFHFFGYGSTHRGWPLVRIDVNVDEKPIKGMQSVCITGWAHRSRKWVPQTAGPSSPGAGQTVGSPKNGSPANNTAAAVTGGGATSLSNPSSPARRHENEPEGKNSCNTMKVRFVLALQFYARLGLLGSVLALKIKQIATHFGRLGIMTFTLNQFSQSLHHARQKMALWAAESQSSLPFPPPPRGGGSLAFLLSLRHFFRFRDVMHWVKRRKLHHRLTLKDVVCNGLTMPPTMTVYESEEGEEKDASLHSSPPSSNSSLSSSELTAMYTTDGEAEREAGLAELEDRCFSIDETLLDDEIFKARIMGLLEDIARVEGILMAQRLHGQ
ncbi:hypothetical protein MOQ_007740 [Trypanosoma cruzi marinkellei]|uniref:Uncharacterized protein n=1 Tax=Trypanosoma cruzi marinkellei TaxID=85056 RepID=K2M0Q1_TRYCR|nr:hypothetical protein MOQ_007740 [Trypanosoma cruzi marinkellei]